jgi:hypothetical protein
MESFKEETHAKNKPKQAERTKSAPGSQTPIAGTTLQRTVSAKVEVTITKQQLDAAKWLFKQSGTQKPGWLRQRFYINQRRRKCLNTELLEAQLDGAYCGHCRNPETWDGLLHTLWHGINGASPCCK